jgi:hypothetical protein
MLIEDTLGKGKKPTLMPAKHYPKPKYDRCNKGHPLQEIYDERQNAYIWDCPICKRKKEEKTIYENCTWDDYCPDAPSTCGYFTDLGCKLKNSRA